MKQEKTKAKSKVPPSLRGRTARLSLEATTSIDRIKKFLDSKVDGMSLSVTQILDIVIKHYSATALPKRRNAKRGRPRKASPAPQPVAEVPAAAAEG